MKYLITGGCGFLGANLAAEALQRGDDVMVADNLSRVGATSNLEWLRSQGLSRFNHLEMRVSSDVAHLVDKFQPDGLLIVRAGGPAGLFSAIIGGWPGQRVREECQAVTHEIR